MVNSKKIIWSICLIIWVLCGISNAWFFQSPAFEWAYEHWLTKFDNLEDFRPSDTLRRDEAIKFIIKFAEWQFELSESSNNCKFSDLNLAWQDLTDYINQACKYGIVNWYNNKFMPNQKLTNEQIIAMIARILYGKQDEETVTRRSDKYYDVMSNYNLINFQNRSKEATRLTVIQLLYDVANEIYVEEDIFEQLVNSLD